MRKVFATLLCVLAVSFHASGAFHIRQPNLKAVFGYCEGWFKIVETNKIPWIKGQMYGFNLKVPGDGGGEVSARVVMQLPGPAINWNSDQPVDVSKDGTSASYPMTVEEGGPMQCRWTVADGDPEGRYTIKVYVEDNLITTFIFEVRRPSSKEGTPAKEPHGSQ